MSSYTCTSNDNLEILFNILTKKAKDMDMLFGWLINIIDELSKANFCDLGAKELRKIIECLKKSFVLWNNDHNKYVHKTCLAEKLTDEAIMESEASKQFSSLLRYTDEAGNNILITLAKHTRDGALREMLTNKNTVNHITHSVLAIRNKYNYTLGVR